MLTNGARLLACLLDWLINCLTTCLTCIDPADLRLYASSTFENLPRPSLVCPFDLTTFVDLRLSARTFVNLREPLSTILAPAFLPRVPSNPPLDEATCYSLIHGGSPLTLAWLWVGVRRRDVIPHTIVIVIIIILSLLHICNHSIYISVSCYVLNYCSYHIYIIDLTMKCYLYPWVWYFASCINIEDSFRSTTSCFLNWPPRHNTLSRCLQHNLLNMALPPLLIVLSQSTYYVFIHSFIHSVCVCVCQLVSVSLPLTVYLPTNLHFPSRRLL